MFWQAKFMIVWLLLVLTFKDGSPSSSCFMLSNAELDTSLNVDAVKSTCGCKNIRIPKEEKSLGKRAYCGQTSNYTDVFAKYDLPDGVLSIDLSNNAITVIGRDFFPPKFSGVARSVIELLFGKNKISYIGPGAFRYFENLKNLNLSSNRIGRINNDMFSGLGKLQKLFLQKNIFPIVPGNAFRNLPSLIKIDLTSKYLVCNYLMRDFISWYQQTKADRKRIKIFGTCQLPEKNQGKPLRTLDVDSLTGEPSKLPYFEIQPAYNQVVFEGDTLPLDCEGTDLSASRVSWNLNGNDVHLNASSYEENTFFFHNKTTILSHVQLDVVPKWSGTWNCTIKSNFSHDYRNVSILVLTNSTRYCDKHTVANEFGEFVWPAAVSGVPVSLTCPIAVNGKDTAMRHCSKDGEWLTGDYSACSYVNEVARLIDNATKQNFSSHNALAICRETTVALHTVKLHEAIGLEKICEFMQKCQRFPYKTSRGIMGKILIGLASKSLSSSSDLMTATQTSIHACRIVANVIKTSAEEMLLNSPKFNVTTDNIALTGFNLSLSKDGLLCNVTTPSTVAINCTSKPQELYKKLSQPTIFLPPTFQADVLPSRGCFLTIYRNGNLFQSSQSHTVKFNEYVIWRDKQAANYSIGHESNSGNDKEMLEVSQPHPVEIERTRYVPVSNAFSVSTSGTSKKNLTQSIVMLFHTEERVSTLKRHLYHYIGIWNGNRWRPSTGECSFNMSATTIEQNNMNICIVECHVLGTFAILKNLDERKDPSKNHGSTRPMHATVYVGASFLSMSLLAVIVTYQLFSSLIISSDARHMLINTCCHLLIGVLAFTVGIWRVDDKVLCYTTGFCLHYSSLSVLFWIVLSARNISKEVVASHQPPSADPKPQRPMLRFYLIGCGIPIVICGITAAAKIQNYNGDEEQYCWLAWNTSIYAFYAPAAFIAIGCLLILLRIVTTLNCSSTGGNARHVKKHFTNKNIIGENTPLQRMDSSFHGSVATEQMSSAMLYIHKEIENEQGFRTRLRGVALTLAFFIATWSSAALSVAAIKMQDFQTVDESSESSVDLNIVFSCLFSTFAVITAIFMIMQHLTSRKDVVTKWRRVCRCGNPPQSQLAGRRSKDIDLIANIKSNDAKRDRTGTLSVTEEGMTLETALPGTTGEETSQTNPASIRTLSDPVMANAINNGMFIVNSVSPGRIGSSAGKSDPKSEGDLCLLKRSANSSHVQLPENCGLGTHVSRRAISPCMKHHYRHDNQHYYKHHYSRSGSKPIKMTNLQHEHREPSLTEHSFDESQINMHTVPVVLQHHPPKLDNGMLYKKYQRLRKNVDAKRTRQQTLTVLREYAQDPLTSNDEDKEKKPATRSNERTTLLGSSEADPFNNEDKINEYLAINEYKKADLNEKLNIAPPEEPKYRTLLISSPNRKKEEEDSKPLVNHILPRKRPNPNLASSYNRRKASHRQDRAVAERRNKTPVSKYHLERKQQAKQSHSKNLAEQEVANENANLPLHGTVASKLLLQPLEKQKNHNYLTADSILKNPFHVPPKKSTVAQSSSVVHTAETSSLLQRVIYPQAGSPEQESEAAVGLEDDRCSTLRTETTV